MKVLVTGISGFLGSHVADHLLQEGFDVHGLIRAGSDLWRLSEIADRIALHNISENSINHILDLVKPDVVINTVCNYNRNSESLNTVLLANLNFGVELLESAVKHGVKIYINSGTLLAPSTNAYALSKYQLVQWMRYYSTRIQSVNLRIEHMIGVKDDQTKFVYWLANAIQNPNDFQEIKLTSGVQLRDFVNVKDVAAVFSTIIKNSNSITKFEEFDVGSGDLTPVRTLVNLMINKLDPLDTLRSSRRLKIGALPYRPTDVMKPNLSITPLKQLGWTPSYSLIESVNEVVDSLNK